MVFSAEGEREREGEGLTVSPSSSSNSDDLLLCLVILSRKRIAEQHSGINLNDQRIKTDAELEIWVSLRSENNRFSNYILVAS